MQLFESSVDEGGLFNSIAVIGLGLIGGSIVKALRLKGYTGSIIGIDPDSETRKLVEASGLFEKVLENASDLSSQVDLLILAVPLGCFTEALRDASHLIGPDTLVTDAGSVKTSVHQVTDTILETNISFIGGHPMAGSDRSGFASASPILFENAYYFLTLGPHFHQTQLEKLQLLVKMIGAIPMITTPEAHDALVVQLSHLPHVAACALVSTFKQHYPEDSLKFAGGGFRDTTRIAMGDPGIWHDIFIQNKRLLSTGIDGLIDELIKFKALLMEDNHDEIKSNLTKTQKTRSRLAARRPSVESSLYPLILDVEDKPGILATVTGLFAEQQLNIKDIALDHARERLPGALILSFATDADRTRAVAIVKTARLCEVYIEQD